MNDEQFDDLKQFVDTRAGQTEAHLKEFIRESLAASEARLIQRIDEGFAGAGNAVVVTQDDLDKLEHRVARLEQRAA